MTGRSVKKSHVAMPDAEKPRVAKAAPAGRFASLSKRQWQDIRRARRLGADGLGGGLRVHGVEIFFPRPLKDVIHTATNGGQNGQRGGERRSRGPVAEQHTVAVQYYSQSNHNVDYY